MKSCQGLLMYKTSACCYWNTAGCWGADITTVVVYTSLIGVCFF